MDASLTIDPDAVLWSVSEDQRQDRPLLVIMHGYGSDEADLFGLVPFLPTEPVIASIRAPRPLGLGFAWFPLNIDRPSTAADATVDEAVRSVLGWLDSLPPAPSVGLLGFSQGGAMAMQLIRYEPRRFSYVVQLSGFLVAGDLPGDSELARLRPPVFWGRGADDAVITPALIDQTTDWLPSHSTLDARVYFGIGHSIATQELADIAAFISTQLES